MDKFAREANHVAKIIDLLGPKQLTLSDTDVIGLLQEVDFKLIHEALCNASADSDGENFNYDSVERLREICSCELDAGPIWRPKVEALLLAGDELTTMLGKLAQPGWYWYDSRDDAPDHHGPFNDERLALIDAIKTKGHNNQ